MHSSVNNHDTSTSILSIKEIVGIVIVFSVVLYLLFPKGDIEGLFEGEQENTNLSINYLESMLLYYPDNVKLQMILVNKYDYAGDSQKATLLNNKIISKTTDKMLLDRLYRTQYQLLKDIYFKTEDKNLLKEIREKLYSYYEFSKDDIDYLFFFAESAQMNFQELKYKSLKGLMKQNPGLVDYEFEKGAFYLASSLGYKEEAYYYLIRLTNYKEVEREIRDYALNSLVEKQEYKKATQIATKLFLSSRDKDDAVRFFNIALYSLVQDKQRVDGDIDRLIQLYLESRDLESHDIFIILDTLLKLGDIKEAGRFAIDMFRNNSDDFDEVAVNLAIKSLIYGSQLKPALEIALFAQDKFQKKDYLDKSIQLSLWLGEMERVVTLNQEGYEKYGDLKYEEYLLSKTTLDSAFEIRGTIYKKRVENGDYNLIEELAEYYDYTGEISEGEQYFDKLLKRVKNQKIHRQAIEFAYENSHFEKGISLYSNYLKKYGIDRELHQMSFEKLIALKQFSKAYNFLKELELLDNNNLQRELIDLSWGEKDYQFLYTLLWKKEKDKTLKKFHYQKLIHLEMALNQGKRVEYIYKKLWKETSNTTYLFALLYLYIKDKSFHQFKEIIDSLDLKVKNSLEKNINYNILLANYYIHTSKTTKASKAFLKALSLDRYNPQTHESYLWFLIDNRLNKALAKELSILRKNSKLQQVVGFPSIVGAMALQKTDLALRWLNPILKSDNLEYQIIYADILELQDRVEGAKKVRIALFKRVNQMIKESPKLLKNREFARVYLRLVTLYVTPYEKRAIYFEQFKSLFKESDFMEMKISWYASTEHSSRVKQLVSKYKIDIPWLNLYLAITQENHEAKQRLLANYREVLPFRDRVIASLDIGDRLGAYRLAFSGLEDNSRDAELYKIYYDMINRDYPKAEIKSILKHLSPKLDAIENQMSYRWSLYRGLESRLDIKQYRFSTKKSKIIDNTLALSLKNSDKKFFWELSLAKHYAKSDFVSSSLDLKYRLSDLTLSLNSKYQNRTQKTTELKVEGMENSLGFNIKKPLNHRTNLSLSYQTSQYKKQNRAKVGTSDHLQFNGNYILRAGYPDINFNAYLSKHRYSSALASNFLEFGTQLSIGANSQHQLQRSWRPFGTLGLAINDNQNIGTNLSLGFTGMFMGEDSLSLIFDYSNGIGVISEPIYGVHLDYRF